MDALAQDLMSGARSIQAEVVDVRRRIHRHPELGLALPRTQQIIVDRLNRLGLPLSLGDGLSSVVATIDGVRPGNTVVLRADMDALPLQEDTGLAFTSAVDGVMHACGHDGHVAMLLGAAELLVERRASILGRVVLMFQPGEEGQFGAKRMLDEGLLSGINTASARAFAIHIHTRFPEGSIHFRPGPILAAPDRLLIRVVGRGGHASAPSRALDPIPVAAEIVLALQTIVSRKLDTFSPTVVTIAHVDGGTTHNVIPDSVTLEGTIRTLSEATRGHVHDLIRQVVAGVCAAHGATGEVDIELGYPVTVNDEASTADVQMAARELIGDARVHEMAEPLMGGEDFSYVLNQVPGSMVFLGARPSDVDEESAPQNHSSHVVFSEDALAVGVGLHALVAMRWLADRAPNGAAMKDGLS